MPPPSRSSSASAIPRSLATASPHTATIGQDVEPYVAFLWAEEGEARPCGELLEGPVPRLPAAARLHHGGVTIATTLLATTTTAPYTTTSANLASS
jgi:hypothetical protein